MGFGIRELASPSESSATSVPKLPNAAPTIQHSTMSPDAIVAARTTASSMGDALAASGLVIPIPYVSRWDGTGSLKNIVSYRA